MGALRRRQGQVKTDMEYKNASLWRVCSLHDMFGLLGFAILACCRAGRHICMSQGLNLCQMESHRFWLKLTTFLVSRSLTKVTLHGGPLEDRRPSSTTAAPSKDGYVSKSPPPRKWLWFCFPLVYLMSRNCLPPPRKWHWFCFPLVYLMSRNCLPPPPPPPPPEMALVLFSFSVFDVSKLPPQEKTEKELWFPFGLFFRILPRTVKQIKKTHPNVAGQVLHISFMNLMFAKGFPIVMHTCMTTGCSARAYNCIFGQCHNGGGLRLGLWVYPRTVPLSGFLN